jgi:GTP-binding protein
VWFSVSQQRKNLLFFEKLYSIRAFKAIRRADVVVFVIDCLAGVVDQDRLLAKRIVEEGRSCIIALNKWDAVPNKDDKSYLSVTAHIRQELPELKFAEVFFFNFH